MQKLHEIGELIWRTVVIVGLSAGFIFLNEWLAQSVGSFITAIVILGCIQPLLPFVMIVGLAVSLKYTLIEWWKNRFDYQEDYYLIVSIVIVYLCVQCVLIGILAFQSPKQLIEKLMPSWFSYFS